MLRSLLPLVLTSALGLVGATAPAAAASPTGGGELAPGDAGLAAGLAELRLLGDDASTGALTNGTHYHASNERDLHLVQPHVDGLGGVLVAVAADPGYILAAWMDAEAIVFLDLDPEVVALHRIYAVFFAAAATPEDFLALWTAAAAERAEAAIRAAITEPASADASVALYLAARPAIDRHLADLERRMAAAGVAWLGGDLELYRRVAALVRAGRVVALRADLTREGVAGEVAGILDRRGLGVGLLYLSNIEQYFMYSPAYRENLLALPFAGGAQVLRTLPGRPAGFEYILQTAAALRSWIASPRVRSVYRIRGLGRGEHLVGRTAIVLDDAPPP